MKTLLFSDTHRHHHEYEITGTYDLAIHTGDFTSSSSEAELDDFLLWYSELPCTHKLLVAGNHDFFPFHRPDEFRQKGYTLNIVYLEDSYITIEGIKFYGTPWVPNFYDWAFMESEKQLVNRYAKIPDDTQVLLTHGPALYTLDEVSRGHVGSEALYDRIQELPNLRLHVFGHIHESRGIHVGDYTSINAACMSPTYSLLEPHLIELELP